MFRHFVFLLIFICSASAVQAAPFAEAGDRQLRNDVEVLAKYGLISGPVMTWPLTWRQITANLYRADEMDNMPAYVRMALARVREKTPREFNASLTVRGTNNPALLRGFDYTARSDVDATLSMELHGETISAKGVIGYRYNEDGGVIDEVPMDGSYFAKEWGNWQVYVGQIDRWWGPGREGTLLLSNSARPMPSIGVRRVMPEAFQSKWLNWIGPWHIETFVGQMEQDRYVPEALIWGINFTFEPVNNLEIQFAKIMQLCGEGRPCGLDTWTEALVGTFGTENTGTLNEPGNQLGTINVSYSFGLTKDAGVKVYAEATAEDEKKNFLFQFARLLGVTSYGSVGNRGDAWRLSVEYADTEPKNYWLFGGVNNPNAIYNHHIYRSGYRYEGRAMGYSLDNNTQVISVVGEYTDSDAWSLALKYHNIRLNKKSDPRNTISSTFEKLDLVEANFQGKIPGKVLPGQISLTTRYMTDQPDTPGEKSDRFDVEVRWRTGF